jgi:hypothetical protein
MPETYTPDNLLAGDYPVVTDIVTILTGQVLARGAILGKITLSGKYILCDSAVNPADGSQVPVCILAEAIDATAADKQAQVYLSGAFNETKLTYGGADTADTHRAALRDLNIYIKKVVAA